MKFSDIINKILISPNSAFFYTPVIYNKSCSYLFLKPEKSVKIKSLNKLNEKLNKIDVLIDEGYEGYSIIHYEAGYFFEKSLNKYLPKNEELIQFYFYDKAAVNTIKSSEIYFDYKDKYQVKNFMLNVSMNEYAKSIRRIKSYIKEGETYQVNYTSKGKFDFIGSLSAFISTLIFNQSAKYIAIINNNSQIIISLSPELFFLINRGKITSKPMKGTEKRGSDLQSDLFAEYSLKNSIKNRAENLMIVDMIRNDLGKISKYGTVKVKEIFEVEKYESVYQMISTVESELNNNIKLSDVIKNIFPCASITGAPKIRTMKIIKDIEKEKRGIYTGGIGLITNNRICFNVPIRTIVINKNSKKGELGLGSGVVWDSNSEEEYSETKLKGKFLTNPVKPFEIIETMLIDYGKIFLLDGHLSRLKATADYFLFNLNETEVKRLLNKIMQQNTESKLKLRLAINKNGKVNYSLSQIIENNSDIKVIISSKKNNSKNLFQYFKTTNRNQYDREYRKYSAKGFFDVIFFNEKSELTEGSITNIFIEKRGIISTPILSSGILNGTYRKYMLDNDASIIERKLYVNDLIEADNIFLTNSVRGIIQVKKIFINENEYIDFPGKQGKQ